jgi:hypothetical protein
MPRRIAGLVAAMLLLALTGCRIPSTDELTAAQAGRGRGSDRPLWLREGGVDCSAPLRLNAAVTSSDGERQRFHPAG